MAGQVSEAKERTIAEMQHKSGLPRSSCELVYAAIEGFAENAFKSGYDSGERAGYQRALEDAERAVDAGEKSWREGECLENGCACWTEHVKTAVRSLAKGKEGSNG